mmetsp:Transcript_88033/g.254113  ORF Transcript_88033/g.254113 Transcript_88033/m.254113 type:complete len:276 (+) Transcript_88033:122-949(+)
MQEVQRAPARRQSSARELRDCRGASHPSERSSSATLCVGLHCLSERRLGHCRILTKSVHDIRHFFRCTSCGVDVVGLPLELLALVLLTDLSHHRAQHLPQKAVLRQGRLRIHAPARAHHDGVSLSPEAHRDFEPLRRRTVLARLLDGQAGIDVVDDIRIGPERRAEGLLNARLRLAGRERVFAVRRLKLGGHTDRWRHPFGRRQHHTGLNGRRTRSEGERRRWGPSEADCHDGSGQCQQETEASTAAAGTGHGRAADTDDSVDHCPGGAGHLGST